MPLAGDIWASIRASISSVSTLSSALVRVAPGAIPLTPTPAWSEIERDVPDEVVGGDLR